MVDKETKHGRRSQPRYALKAVLIVELLSDLEKRYSFSFSATTSSAFTAGLVECVPALDVHLIAVRQLDRRTLLCSDRTLADDTNLR